MKISFIIAFKLTLVTVVLFCGIYIFSVWGIAQLTPNSGLTNENLIGQNFTSQKYFWPRPSAANYDASASAGSNLGPTNIAYIQIIKDRIDSVIKHHPYLKAEDIPSDWVTASGSGLDPHISAQAAKIQILRIAEYRHIPAKRIEELVNKNTEEPFLGFIGTEKINVLQLNKDLDKLNPF